MFAQWAFYQQLPHHAETHTPSILESSMSGGGPEMARIIDIEAALLQLWLDERLDEWLDEYFSTVLEN